MTNKPNWDELGEHEEGAAASQAMMLLLGLIFLSTASFWKLRP